MDEKKQKMLSEQNVEVNSRMAAASIADLNLQKQQPIRS